MQASHIFVIESEAKLSSTIQDCIDSRCLDSQEEKRLFKVETHTDNSSASEAFKTHFGDMNFSPISNTIVFVDLYFDDCDGLSLIEQLRNDYHQLNIIAFLPESNITQGALENLELRNQAEAAGANATLIAPFNLREVVSTVNRLMETETKPYVSSEAASLRPAI